MGACVFSTPPSDLPIPPPIRPAIVRASLSPPIDPPNGGPITSLLLSGTPFDAEVDCDPSLELDWEVFIDYGGAGVVPPQGGRIPATNGARRRPIPQFKLSQSTPGINSSPGSCHTITLFVAYSITNQLTPANNDGDQATWQYNPGGTYAGCPTLDAGGLPVPDASDSAADGGTQ